MKKKKITLFPKTSTKRRTPVKPYQAIRKIDWALSRNCLFPPRGGCPYFQNRNLLDIRVNFADSWMFTSNILGTFGYPIFSISRVIFQAPSVSDMLYEKFLESSIVLLFILRIILFQNGNPLLNQFSALWITNVLDR